MRTLRRRGEEWLSMTQSHLFFDQLFEWHTHQPIPPIPTLVSMERQLTTHSFLLILQTINFKNIEETRLRSWGRPTPTPPESLLYRGDQQRHEQHRPPPPLPPPCEDWSEVVINGFQERRFEIRERGERERERKGGGDCGCGWFQQEGAKCISNKRQLGRLWWSGEISMKMRSRQESCSTSDCWSPSPSEP